MMKFFFVVFPFNICSTLQNKCQMYCKKYREKLSNHPYYIDKNFIYASICCLLGLSMIIFPCSNSTAIGIGASMVAAYIFYFLVEYIPEKSRNYNRMYDEVAAYRLLQLLLYRYDKLYIHPYESKHGNLEAAKIKLSKFFSEETVCTYAKDFSVNTIMENHMICHPNGMEEKLTFFKYASITWVQIQQLIHELNICNYTRVHAKLYYLLFYLKYESITSIYFEITNRIFTPLEYINMVFSDNAQYQRPHFEAIIQLHEIAFSMYRNLKSDPRWKNLTPPPFYSEN